MKLRLRVEHGNHFWNLMGRGQDRRSRLADPRPADPRLPFANNWMGVSGGFYGFSVFNLYLGGLISPTNMFQVR